MKRKRSWALLVWVILGLFVAYLIQIFTFAFVYRKIHIADPQAFVFNSAIVERQVSEDLAIIDGELAKLKIRNNAIAQSLTFPSRILDSKATPTLRVPLANRVVMNYGYKGVEMTIWFDPGGLKEHGFLLITDTKHPEWSGFHAEIKFNPSDDFFDEKGFPTEKPDVSAKLIEEFSVELLDEQKLLRESIANLETERKFITPQTPRWSGTEYLYFSVIVLGGGSGDIIPNSRFVRQIVIVQFLFSVGLVVFLLSAVTAALSNRD